MHRVAGVAGRRHLQGRAAGRGERALCLHGARRPRLLLLRHHEREQAQHGVRSQIAARQGRGVAADRKGGRHDREHVARRDREAGPGLRRGEEDQPAPHLRADQGLRARESVRQVPELRHDRAGCRRGICHHRRGRRAAAAAGTPRRRYRCRFALPDRHPRGAQPASPHRPRPAGRSDDAGFRDQLQPHLLRRATDERQDRSSAPATRARWAPPRRASCTSASRAGPTTGSWFTPRAPGTGTGSACSR